MSNPIDQIDAMLALCALGPMPTAQGKTEAEYYRELTEWTERSARAERASRTGWEATLRALKVAVEAIENHPNRNVGDDGWMWERDALAKIAKELEGMG